MIVGGKNNLIGISGKIGSGKDTVGSILQDYSDNDYQIKKFADKLKEIACLLIGCTRKQLEDREFKEKELGEEWWQYGLIRENTRKPILYPSKKEDIEKQLKVFNNARMYINKLTPRKLLQLLGTECGREIIHPNIWVNALFADYKHIWNDPDPIKGNDYNITYRKDYPNTEESLIQYGGGSEAEVFTREIEQSKWIITDVRFPNEAQAIKDRGGIVIRVKRPLDRLGNSKLPKLKHTSVTQHPSETALDDYDFDYVIENEGSIEELVEKVKQLKLI